MPFPSCFLLCAESSKTVLFTCALTFIVGSNINSYSCIEMEHCHFLLVFKQQLNVCHFSAGSLFLFDRKVIRYFRKDSYRWRKKKDGKTVKEAHEKLKVCCSIYYLLVQFFCLWGGVVGFRVAPNWCSQKCCLGITSCSCLDLLSLVSHCRQATPSNAPSCFNKSFVWLPGCVSTSMDNWRYSQLFNYWVFVALT